MVTVAAAGPRAIAVDAAVAVAAGASPAAGAERSGWAPQAVAQSASTSAARDSGRAIELRPRALPRAT